MQYIVVVAVVLQFLLVSFHSYAVPFHGWLQKIVFAKRNKQSLHDLESLVKLRTGAKGSSVWYYQGLLRSSMTGDEIAGIEGFEVIRFLNSSYNVSTPSYKSTYLSKKTFVYVDKSNHSQPLEYYRKQKVSPARATKPLKVIEELVTLSCSPQLSRPLNVTITWPGGRQLHSKKLSLRTNSLHKGLTDRILGKQQVDVAHSSTGLISGPALGRLISFSSPSSSSHGKTQEYYSIVNKGHFFFPSPPKFNESSRPESGVQISYRRFGESPPWFAVNKGAIVELHGYRYDKFNRIPKDIRNKLSVLMPQGFQEDFSMADFSASTDPLSLYAPWYQKLWRAVSRR